MGTGSQPLGRRPSPDRCAVPARPHRTHEASHAARRVGCSQLGRQDTCALACKRGRRVHGARTCCSAKSSWRSVASTASAAEGLLASSGRMPRYSRHCRARASPLIAHLQHGRRAWAGTRTVIASCQMCSTQRVALLLWKGVRYLAVHDSPTAGDDQGQMGRLYNTRWVHAALVGLPWVGLWHNDGQHRYRRAVPAPSSGDCVSSVSIHRASLVTATSSL